MNPAAPLFLALVHYPVYNAHQEIVCTSITPFDLHDIARIAKTYGISKYFVICPLESQKKLAQRIMDHWLIGVGGELNQTRKDAFGQVQLVDSLEEARLTIQGDVGSQPRLIATSARQGPNRISIGDLRDQLQARPQPHLILFGTGWGMAQELMDRTDGILEPIAGGGDGSYNHLSVRSAVAIILDRLLADSRSFSDASATGI